jgi:hypothetical protein
VRDEAIAGAAGVTPPNQNGAKERESFYPLGMSKFLMTGLRPEIHLNGHIGRRP